MLPCSTPPPTPLIAQCRWLGNDHNPTPETLHTGWWAVCNSAGNVINESHPQASAHQSFWRSTTKFIQALPLIEAGLHHQQPAECLAVLCSSHVGSPWHQQLASHWLHTANLSPTCLQCGIHPPVDIPTRHALIRQGQLPTALHHNCSGKHAGMLAVCQHYGWPLASYRDATHPLQQRSAALITERLHLTEPLPTATDGCGVPTFYGTVGQLAQLYAALTTDTLAQPLLAAVIQQPTAFGGTQRMDSTLIEVSEGALIGKVGADGVFAVMNRPLQQGFALKLADGHEEARNRAVVAALLHLEWLTPAQYQHPLLQPWTDTTIVNASHTAVGQWQWLGE